MSSYSLGKWSYTEDVIRAYRTEAEDIKNQTIIITGSNTGIGKETARVLAALGGNIILACRSEEKANAAAEDIRASHAGSRVSFIPLDLSSQTSIRSFLPLYESLKAQNSWPPLRILILNAGVFPLGGYAVSPDSCESTFATNHLGNFLLTKLLLHELRTNGNSRVVVLASESHRGPVLSVDMRNKEDVMQNVAKCSEKQFSLLGAYGTSKLCNVMFASKLQEEESKLGTSVSACSLHPGTMIGTDIARDSWIANLVFKSVVSWFTKNINQGASTTVMCCLLPRAELQGKYFSDCAELLPTTIARDAAAQNILWEISDELTATKN